MHEEEVPKFKKGDRVKAHTTALMDMWTTQIVWVIQNESGWYHKALTYVERKKFGAFRGATFSFIKSACEEEGIVCDHECQAFVYLELWLGLGGSPGMARSIDNTNLAPHFNKLLASSRYDEATQPDARPEQKEFEVGDKVRIVRRVTDRRGGWNSDMDNYVDDGKIYTIKGTWEGEYGFFLHEIAWMWAGETLELVEAYEHPYTAKRIKGRTVTATSTVAQPKEQQMKIETGVILIDGTNATKFSDDDIFNNINSLELQISNLGKTVNKPKKLEAKIAALQEQIVLLIAIVDSRP